ncbi:hypothetical protein PROFUN_06931 [Planoprotostelium fungivorum]|uniref:SP-RING-type domain-containing protein n=1 Tax=Planoprotostelium fungivorum TaxID=1890364 RepID=A0A2P6NN17_9EUKA|nr:hypothetical protein PROFUN_06931 [Planoprotostelium fungivorum]
MTEAVSAIREMDTAIQRHQTLLNELGIAMSHTSETAISIAEFDANEKKLKDMEETMKLYVELSVNIKRHMETAESVKAAINRQREIHIVKPFEDHLNKLNKKDAAKEAESHPKLIDYQKKIWKAQYPNKPFPGEDDDLIITNDEIDINCPITKKQLVKPMRNMACGHHYEQSAIEEYLKSMRKHRQIDCPVAGCSKTVSKTSLEYDKSMEREVKKRAMSQRPDSEDEEEYTQI